MTRVLMFVGDIYEDLELWYPKYRLQEAGAEVVLAGQKAGEEYEGKNGYPCRSDVAIASVSPEEFDGLVCPGGFMPDKLRRDPKVLEIVRSFDRRKKLIGAICHGGWIPISAGVYRGVRVTGSPGIKDDLVNAGALWEDSSVVVDRHFVSSRKPDDLPDFSRGLLQVLGLAAEKSQNMKVSTRNKAAGTANIAKGKIKAGTGRVTGNRNLQARGRAQQAAGRVQKRVGRAQKMVGE